MMARTLGDVLRHDIPDQVFEPADGGRQARSGWRSVVARPANQRNGAIGRRQLVCQINQASNPDVRVLAVGPIDGQEGSFVSLRAANGNELERNPGKAVCELICSGSGGNCAAGL